MKSKKTLLFLLAICFCLMSLAPLSFAVESVYLSNNIHYQTKRGRNGDVHWASYANYISPNTGHNIIPVNTKVTIVRKSTIRGRGLLIKVLEDGKQVNMQYNSRNMVMSMPEYMGVITSPKKTDISKMSELDKKGIKEGKAYVGMTKDGIKIALGFPAQHRTPSLSSNIWTYWRDRFRTTVIEFDAQGKVIDIK